MAGRGYGRGPANSGTLNGCRERPLVVEIPGLDRGRDCNRL